MTATYPDTYYAATASAASPYPPLSGDAHADVAVIGGGFTGTSAALTLAEAGKKVVLVEASRIGFAASGRNGGQIHSGFRWDQAHFEHAFGDERAHDLWQLSQDAKALVRTRVKKYAVDCALVDGLLIAAHSWRAARALLEEVAHMNRHYGKGLMRYVPLGETRARTGSPIYRGAMEDLGGGHLHPLHYVLGIAQAAQRAGAALHENTRATAIEPTSANVTVRTDNGTITADHVIVATDAFVETLVPRLARYIAPVESHLVATAPLSPEQRRTVLPKNDAVADTRFVLDYYRLSEDGRMVFSGGERFTEPDRHIERLVRPRMEFVFPQLKGIPIDYVWSGTVGITATRLPHFGRSHERVLFGYGYSGHGVALANMGGKAMADAVLGDARRFDLFASIPPKAFPGPAGMRRPLVALTLKAMTLADQLP